MKLKSGKPSTVYSDNPKMNTAKVESGADPMDVMVSVRGFAMGGYVSPYEESPVKDRLARQAEMRKQLDEEMKKRRRS